MVHYYAEHWYDLLISARGLPEPYRTYQPPLGIAADGAAQDPLLGQSITGHAQAYPRDIPSDRPEPEVRRPGQGIRVIFSDGYLSKSLKLRDFSGGTL